VRSSLRTYVRKARSTVAAGALDEAPDLVKLAASQLDKAASKGVIHPNQAARRKSRLMKALAAAGVAAQEEQPAEAAATPARSRTRAAGTTNRAASSRSRSTAATKSNAAEAKPRATRSRAASTEERPAAKPRATRARQTKSE
jgi:small subunit ribosomal protein S20